MMGSPNTGDELAHGIAHAGSILRQPPARVMVAALAAVSLYLHDETQAMPATSRWTRAGRLAGLRPFDRAASPSRVMVPTIRHKPMRPVYAGDERLRGAR